MAARSQSVSKITPKSAPTRLTASAIEAIARHLMLIFFAFRDLYRLFVNDECNEPRNRIGLNLIFDSLFIQALCKSVQFGIKLKSVVCRDSLVLCRLLVNQNNDPLPFFRGSLLCHISLLRKDEYSVFLTYSVKIL